MKKSIEVDTNMVRVLKLTNWDAKVTTHNIQKDLKKNVDNMWMGGDLCLQSLPFMAGPSSTCTYLHQVHAPNTLVT